MQYRERPILSAKDEWDDLSGPQKWREYQFVLGLLRKYRDERTAGSPSARGKIDEVGRQQRNMGAKWAAWGNTAAMVFVQFPWAAFIWLPLFGATAWSKMNETGWVTMVSDLFQAYLGTQIAFWIAHYQKKNYHSD